MFVYNLYFVFGTKERKFEDSCRPMVTGQEGRQWMNATSACVPITGTDKKFEIISKQDNICWISVESYISIRLFGVEPDSLPMLNCEWRLSNGHLGFPSSSLPVHLMPNKQNAIRIFINWKSITVPIHIKLLNQLLITTSKKSILANLEENHIT